MPERETTRDILHRYQEIGHREALKTWRANVPPDARRAWIRDFIKDAGRDKLADTFPAILKKYLNPDDLRKLEGYKVKLAQDEEKIAEARKNPPPLKPWEDEDNPFAGLHEGIADTSLDLDTFLKSVYIPDAAYEEFAEHYFLTLDTNAERTKEFFEQQARQVAMVAKALSEAFTPNLLACLVVYGSGALGPRTSAYSKEQDLDLLVIPRMDKGAQPSTLKEISNTIHELDEFLHGKIPYLPPSIARLTTPWGGVASAFETQHSSLDLFAPAMLEGASPSAHDWKKLCGPHRVAHTFGPDWEASYRSVLQKSIESAK